MTEDINRPPQGPTVSGGGVTDPVGDPMPQTSEPIAATGSHDSGGASPDSRADTAKQEASKTAQNAQAQAAHVAETAADEAKQTVGEAKRQAMDLLRQTSTELNEQAGTQLERFTNGLQGFSSQARQMADGAEQDGSAATLVRWASETAGDAGRWLEGRDPSAVLEEVKRYARRRPGMFVLVAAGLGLAAGRIARSLKDAGQDDGGAHAAGIDASPAYAPAAVTGGGTSGAAVPVPAAAPPPVPAATPPPVPPRPRTADRVPPPSIPPGAPGPSGGQPSGRHDEGRAT